MAQPISTKLDNPKRSLTSPFNDLSAWLIGATIIITTITWFLFQPAINRLTVDILNIVSPADQPIDEDIVILQIDEATLEAMPDAWPWPREYYGEILYLLADLGADQVGFDIQFIDPREGDGDQYFAQAIREVGGVVLASDLAERNTGFFSGVIALEPLSILLDAGARAGLVGVDGDVDRVIRYAPTYEKTFSQLLSGEVEQLPRSGQRLLRYLGPGGSFKTISLMQLFIENGIAREQIEGKTVLIGWGTRGVVDASGGQVDQFPSPWTRWNGLTMPGVEIHANLINNYRQDLWVYQPTSAITLIGLLLTAIVLIIPMIQFRPLLSLLFPTVLIMLLMVASIWLWERGHFFNAILGAPILFFAYLTASIRAYLTEGKQKRQLRSAFGQYLSPDMVSSLVADPSKLKLGGETREMTIMFCDIRGFTNISESLKDEPLKLTEVINRLLTGLTTEILSTGGTIDKYMGDCIMAFWNAPLYQIGHPKLAVQSAQSMLNNIEKINEKLIADELTTAPLRIGIGIGTGVCVVGNMGSEQRFDYTVLGDVVNTISRLEGMTKEYNIAALLTELTVSSLSGEDKKNIVEIDWVRMKGKSDTTTIFGLLKNPLPDEEQSRVADMLVAYRQGDFTKCLIELECLRDSKQLSGYVSTMKTRVAQMSASKTQGSWDGVFRATQK